MSLCVCVCVCHVIKYSFIQQFTYCIGLSSVPVYSTIGLSLEPKLSTIGLPLVPMGRGAMGRGAYIWQIKPRIECNPPWFPNIFKTKIIVTLILTSLSLLISRAFLLAALSAIVFAACSNNLSLAMWLDRGCLRALLLCCILRSSTLQELVLFGLSIYTRIERLLRQILLLGRLCQDTRPPCTCLYTLICMHLRTHTCTFVYSCYSPLVA